MCKHRLEYESEELDCLECENAEKDEATELGGADVRLNLLLAAIDNKELCVFGRPQPQGDADEPRYELCMIGPERILKAFFDLL